MSSRKNYSNTLGSEVEKRGPVARNSRRRDSIEDGTGDEVPLQPLQPSHERGGSSFKGDRNIRVSTKAWHSDEDDRELYLGREPSDERIVVTTTHNITSK